MPTPISSESGNESQPVSPPPHRQSTFSLSTDTASPPAPKKTSSPVSLDADPGFLPPSAKRNALWSIARNPYALYAYWTLAVPVLRIPGATLALTVHTADGAHDSTHRLHDTAGTVIFPVTRPDTLYRLTLGFLPHTKSTRDEMLFVVAETNARTPRDRPLNPPHSPTADTDVLSPPSGRSPYALALLYPEIHRRIDTPGSPHHPSPAHIPGH